MPAAVGGTTPPCFICESTVSSGTPTVYHFPRAWSRGGSPPSSARRNTHPSPGPMREEGPPTPGSLRGRVDCPPLRLYRWDPGPDSFSEKIRPRLRDAPASAHLLIIPRSGSPFLRAEKILVIPRKEHRLCNPQIKPGLSRRTYIPKTNSHTFNGKKPRDSFLCIGR